MYIITKLNWVDLLVVILMLRTTYVAFQDGLSHEIFPLVGVFSSLILSIHYYKKIAYLMAEGVGILPASIRNLLSFILVFVAVMLIFKLIRFVFEKIVKITWNPIIEKFGGLLVGLAKASFITSAILIILAMIPLSYLKSSIQERSLTGMYFLKIGPTVYSRMVQAEAGADNILGDILSGVPQDENAKKKAKKAPDWEKPFSNKQ